MKNVKVHLLVVVSALAGLALAVFLTAGISRGQTKTPQSPQGPQLDSKVKPTVLLSDRNSPATKNPAVFATAATTNSQLRNDLSWTFGSKQQHGWYLYNQLIDRTLNIRNGASSTDFAAAVSAWQKKSGLIPDGVLDEPSFMAMVAQWQDTRIKNRELAEPDQLITAPITDFYDPERLVELRQVERNTYAAYKKMLAAAIADPTLHLAHTPKGELLDTEKYFKIISSFRSREYQEQLRRQSPHAGTAGLAINSPHFTGRALDIYVGGDPVDTRDSNRFFQVNTPVYRWLVRNAERFGFRPYFYEPWHWEYVR